MIQPFNQSHWLRLEDTHWFKDIGVESFTKEFAAHIHANAALVSNLSRLVIDVNRPTDSDTLIRKIADGKDINFNKGKFAFKLQKSLIEFLDISDGVKQHRIRYYHVPYHHQLRYLTSVIQPSLILSLHSFTNLYEGQPREVEVGVLYDKCEEPAKAVSNNIKLRIFQEFSEKLKKVHLLCVISLLFRKVLGKF